MPIRTLMAAGALVLIATACGGDSGDSTTSTSLPPTSAAPVFSTTTKATTTTAPDTTASDTTKTGGTSVSSTQPAPEGPLTLAAPAAVITVDGDAADWDAIPGMELTLEPIVTVDDVAPAGASVKAAHDDEYMYILMTVDDDFDWNAEDPHLSGAPSVMWAIEPGAGAHMGVEAEDGEGPSLGMVDIWHWEVECAIGENQGGAVSAVDEAKPGNDPGCNFDDEFATDPEERYDDGDSEGPAGTGAENSLLGVFTHTNPVAGGDGTWVFEMRRPLQTGDSQDAQFTIGGTALMALAYWDADNSPEGWDDDTHIQSSSLGWIEVTLV